MKNTGKGVKTSAKQSEWRFTKTDGKPKWKGYILYNANYRHSRKEISMKTARIGGFQGLEDREGWLEHDQLLGHKTTLHNSLIANIWLYIVKPTEGQKEQILAK